MEENKLDKLFRESAEQFSPTPIPSSWTMIENQLEDRKAPIWKYTTIAASVVLIIGFILFINKGTFNSQENTIIAQIEVPEKKHEIQLNLKVPTYSSLSISVKTENSINKKPILDRSMQDLAIEETTNLEILVIDIERINSISIASSVSPELPDIFKESEAIIQIKYYADATQTEKPSSKRKIGDLIDIAQSTSPAEVLANIREVKDNFISTKFSLD